MSKIKKSNHLQATATLSTETTLRGTQSCCEGIPERAARSTCKRRRLSVTRRPFRGTRSCCEGIPERAAPGDDQQIVEEDNLESLAAPLAHALYIPLSLPRIFRAWSFTRPWRRNTKKYNEEPPPERSGEGGSSLHGQQLLHGGAGTPNEGQLGHASNTKAPFDEKHAKPTYYRGRIL